MKTKTKTQTSAEEAVKLLESVLEAVQDLFILQALNSGATVEQVRQLLHVDKWRVTNVSKLLRRRNADR